MAMEARLQKELVVGLVAIVLTMLEFFVASFVIGSQLVLAPTVLLLGLSLVWSLVITVAIGLAEQWYTVVALVVMAAGSVVLAGNVSIGALVAAALLVISLLLVRRFVTHELDTRVAYRTSDVFFGGLKVAIIGLILALAGMTVPSLESSLQSGQLGFTAEQVSNVLQPFFAATGENAVPGATSTVDELIDQQLAAQGIDSQSVTAEQRATARAEISQRLQVPVEGGETASDVAASRVHLWLSSLAQTSPLAFATGVLLLLVLTVRAFVPLIAWALLTPMALGILLARKVELLRLTESQQPVERLRF